MRHSSGAKALHACNCGRSRKTREDPFSLIDANTLFFDMPCCRLAIPLVQYPPPMLLTFVH